MRHGSIGLLDALYEGRERIRTISVRHEQAAGLMADASCRVPDLQMAAFGERELATSFA